MRNDEGGRGVSYPIGSYLRLKLSVITKQLEAMDLLINTVTDEPSSWEVCTRFISLFSDAHSFMDNATRYRQLVELFETDAKENVLGVGYI